MPHTPEVLSPADISFFLQNGYLKIPACFPRSAADPLLTTLWTRLDMSPHDKSTWTRERTNMPSHTSFDAAVFAPRAWSAICDLLGGPARVADWSRMWKDSWIVNLGTKHGEGKDVPGRELAGWHVDGDFFVHYLDSAEQGLLVIPLFTDIQPGGGGTALLPAAIPAVARHLYENSEGVSPRMGLRGRDGTFAEKEGLGWFNDLARRCSEDGLVEATGEVGDVYLLHPLMLHSASNNRLRALRVITNPPVALREPFCFDREDEGEYSVVERATLRALGRQRLEGWGIRGARERIVPERERVQARMKEEEERRLRAQGVKA